MLINASAILVLAERKIMGFMQQRFGPYLVGPHGVLQPLADILKLLFKEELRPKGADKWLFTLAPMLSILTAFVAFATVPLGAETTFFGLLDEPVKLGVADVNVGLLVVFAVTSMGVYGIVLAGWASNSKYSLFGGLRASAQMISYELSYATSLAAVIMLAGSLSLREVVDAQAGTWFGFIPRWYIFLQPIGFIIYVIAGVAETNRAPFDFPEAEQELVAGYNTEYSSVRFALFPQAEYINMATMSAVATDLYLGGWHGRSLPTEYGPWLARVPRQGGRHSLRLHLDALDRSAVPLRPVDAVRMEVAVPGIGDQSDRDGRAGAVPQCLRPSSSTHSRRVAIGASTLVIGQRNPMYSVLLLIASFGALSGLYIQLDAPFVAVAQIIIYAGAIMVLFLFVVMLLNAPREDAAEWDRSHPLQHPNIGRFGGLLATLLIVQLVWALAKRQRARGAGRFAHRCRVGRLGRGDGARAVHPSHLRVRGDVGVDSRRDGRRRGAGAPGRR